MKEEAGSARVAQAFRPCNLAERASRPPCDQPPHRTIDRRGFLAAAVASAGISPRAFASGLARTKQSRTPIVLYSSVDDVLLRQVVELFHAQHGERYEIKLVGDTEATKTTGLVQRLIAEKDAPRADVWWSSEALGTAILAREGVLAAYRPEAIGRDLPEGAEWPTELVQERWTGFACRARVMVVNTKRVPEVERATRLRELVDSKWKGRIGIARPEFGTTRGHMAALLAEHGEAAFVEWLRGLKANSVELFDGNATVVRACASGEIDVGLTDTDDVWAGLARGWPVVMVFEARDEATTRDARERDGASVGEKPDAAGEALPSRGPLLIPNTLGLVAGGRNPEGGRALIEFLLGADVERALARSESRNLPMRPGLASEFEDTRVPGAWGVDSRHVLESMPKAMEIVGDTLG